MDNEVRKIVKEFDVIRWRGTPTETIEKFLKSNNINFYNIGNSLRVYIPSEGGREQSLDVGDYIVKDVLTGKIRQVPQYSFENWEAAIEWRLFNED